MLKSYRTLLLNADYFPLKIITWQKAITLLYKGKATQVDFYRTEALRDGHGREYPIPAVIILKQYKRKNYTKVALTKLNVFARDRYLCQYCGEKFNRSELTLDHVLPKSKNGGKSWQNIVTACYTCNRRKRDRTCSQSGMYPINTPKQPSYEDIFYSMNFYSRVEPEWLSWLSVFSSFSHT